MQMFELKYFFNSQYAFSENEINFKMKNVISLELLENQISLD